MTNLELLMLAQIRTAGLPEPEQEYRFHPSRKWRFDFAWPDLLLAVEVEGGTWARGRHTRGKGFRGDCIKYGEALILGWQVLRATGDMIEDGTAIEMLVRAFEVVAV